MENYVQSMLRAAAFYDAESELVFHLFYTHSASLDKFDIRLQPQYEIDLKPHHHARMLWNAYTLRKRKQR
jgi:hypothetical protein